MDISTRHSASSGYGVDDRKYAQREPYSRELRGTHTDRIMRRRNDHSRSNRYGGSRASKGPYDRHQELTLREKAETTKHKVNTSKASQYEREEPLTSSREIVPYEQTSGTRNNGPNGPNAQQVMRSGEGYIAKRLASTIVTPSRALFSTCSVSMTGTRLLDELAKAVRSLVLLFQSNYVRLDPRKGESETSGKLRVS
ncbi:hypothetical protein YC2023_040183 [Brassica napus]